MHITILWETFNQICFVKTWQISLQTKVEHTPVIADSHSNSIYFFELNLVYRMSQEIPGTILSLRNSSNCETFWISPEIVSKSEYFLKV